MTDRRTLFLSPAPGVAGAWCREQASPGSVFIAPSALARSLALRSVTERSGVSLGLTVASRSRFLPLLEARAGLPAPAMLSETLERLLISEASRTARVPLFDDDAHAPPAGAVRAVANLIRSLRLNRVTPQAFLDAGGDPLAAEAYRLFELRRHALGYVDEADRVDALLAVGVPALALVIEDPAFPHRVARDLYEAAIGASTSCSIGAAVLSPDRAAPAWTTTLDALGFVVQRDERALADPIVRAAGGVGIHDEIELAAREMLALLRSNEKVTDSDSKIPRPVRPNDLLGVAPNGRYLLLLHEACARLGIPVASPRRRETTDVPLVRPIVETFRLLAVPEEDTIDQGLALLATPYLGLPLEIHDELSRALLVRGLGSLRSWHGVASSSRSKKFVAFAESVEKLAKRLEGEHSPNDLASILTSLALDFGFLSSGRRFHLAAGRDDSLRLDQQGWESLTDSTAELNNSLREFGVQRITARRWLTELIELLATTTVRVDAKARDGVHLTIAGAGLPSAPHVFAVGWREGVFPRRTREGPLLPERVKKLLNENGALLPLVADRTTQEYERRERIRRAARDSLTIFWPSTGEDGDRLLPSFYLDDLGISRASRTERAVGDTTWPLPLAASRGERFARATLLARHRPTDTVGAELNTVRGALTAMTDRERRSYDGLLHAAQKISLPAEILAESMPLAATMSASQAKMVVHCLYEHFGKRRLQLEALTSPQLDSRLLGSIAHSVLNDIGRGGFDSGLVASQLSHWWATEIPPELREDPRVHFEHEILLTNLTTLVANEALHLAASGSYATYFELSFGTNDEGRDPSSLAQGLEVELPAGTALKTSILRGAIDRVDTVERNGIRYGVAIDYKSGKGDRYGKEMREMADFQLPIYCEVLPRFGVEPVGAFYLGIASGERYGVVRSDFAASFVRADSKGVLLLSPEDFAAYMRERQIALRSQIARLARGDLAVAPRHDNCGYCDLRPMCRIGTFAVGGSGDED